MMQQTEIKQHVPSSQFSDVTDDPSVLIVDDSSDQLMLMEGLLRRAGYRVLVAGDGFEAFDLAKRHHPDLVISDVCMPRVNGFDLCRLLRDDNRLRSVPILLVSALEKDTGPMVAGLRAGADDYLEIPFNSTRLIAKVARLLERSRLEAKYRDLVEQTDDLIFTHDLTGRLTSLNSAAVDFLGRKLKDLLGLSFASVFGLVGADDFNGNGFAHRVGIRGEFRHQFIARRSSGEKRWLDLTISPIRNKADQPVGFRGIARDITAHKQAELALRDSEERYRLLFESTPQPIWVYDLQTLRFLTVNEAAIHTYGYTRDEFRSMTVDDIRLEEGSDLSGPRRHRTKAGQTIYVEISSHPVLFDGQKSELVIINDVTERKLLDEKQQRLHASLRQSAIEWRQTFDAIDFPVLIVDLEGTVKRANEAAENAAGAEAESLVGKNLADLLERQPWKKASELIKKIRETGFPVSSEERDETTGKTWTLTLFSVDDPVCVADRAILIAQDITRRVELEASLRQSKMMSLLGSVTAGVAHEVRNPLFGISSILDAFEMRFGDRTEYARYTNLLRDEIHRLTVLMEGLLEYGKPFRGDVYPESLQEMITRSIRACLPTAKAAHVKLVNKVPDSLPRIMVDRRSISTVFVNLIENAIQHSPSDGVVTIEADIVREGSQDWIQCAVKDVGPGIQPENLPRIFEPFFSARHGGTGLGLAIAQKTMEEHGGKLLAGNDPQAGACMIARFPVSTEVITDV